MTFSMTSLSKLHRPAQLFVDGWFAHQSRLLSNRSAFTQKSCCREASVKKDKEENVRSLTAMFTSYLSDEWNHSLKALKLEVEICQNEIEEWKKMVR